VSPGLTGFMMAVVPVVVWVTARFRGYVQQSYRRIRVAIARINAGDFRPTPDEFICAGCPALDVVCAGPRLRSASYAEHALATVS